jgi:tRNA A37 threonylcarbamoyladenosine dehydratase
MKVNDSEDLISYDCVTNMNGKGIEGPEGYGFFILFKDNYNNLEFIACACKFTEEYKNAPDKIGGSKRAYIKQLIKELKKDNKDFEGNIFKSMENINLDKILGYRKSGQKHSYLDNYDNLIRKEDSFSRSEKLLGKDNMQKLKESKVLLFGVGGVGGHIAEALARSGIGRIDLVDDDVVSSSNINRQIVALNSTIGHHKVDVMRERIIDINPKCEVKGFKLFYLPKNSNTFDFSQYDYVIDAVDTVTAKIEIIEKAKQANVKVISAMGAGNKLDPTKFVVTDIYKTKVCPLAKVMRHELKKRGITDLKVVYSTEEALKVEANENEKPIPGSVSFVPSVCGLIVASEVIKDLTNKETENA